MELSPLGFLEELLQPPRRDSWTPLTPPTDHFFSNNGWTCFDAFDDTSSLPTSNPSFAGMLAATEPPAAGFECPFSSDQTYPYVDGYAGVVVPEIGRTSPFPATQHEEHYTSMIEDGDEFEILGKLGVEERNSECSKVEMEQQGSSGNNNAQVFNMGLCGGEKRSKSKKLEGQPSKNLMAERRRRKRLNDRLSMLRSIVPKISKMDRTSILGDTIDYMKELLERINKLQEGEEGSDTNQANLLNNLKEKPNEVTVRNSPKFHVDRREIDTRIDICCATKPGLLISTVNTLDALGLEIQQCVISCFNDFSLQASCSEVAEQRTIISPEDIKQALFRAAGYGGRCL